MTAKAPPAEPVAYDDDGFEDEGQNAAEPMDPVEFASVQDDEVQDEPDQAVATGAGLAAFDAEIAGLDDDAEDDDVEGDRLADIIAARGEQAIPSFLRSRGVSSLDEKLAEYDTAVSQAAEELEPVQDNDATDPDALNWEDHVDEAGEDRLDNADLYSDEDAEEDDVEIDRAAYWAEDDDDEDTAEPSQLALGGVASDLLDEDMLRDLVAELVRQELQGALGERITRNVRKLVRREIQRTLAAHDLL